jgi:hypothetical protein
VIGGACVVLGAGFVMACLRSRLRRLPCAGKREPAGRGRSDDSSPGLGGLRDLGPDFGVPIDVGEADAERGAAAAAREAPGGAAALPASPYDAEG